jgi:hypothetical protein
MKQRSGRAVICAIVTGLLAAGAVTATMEVATANVAGFCDANGAKASCTSGTQTAATSGGANQRWYQA